MHIISVFPYKGELTVALKIQKLEISIRPPQSIPLPMK
jgi:hypothetical protein